MRTTQNDCPTPKTNASKDIMVFPAALYTPAMAAPEGHKQVYDFMQACKHENVEKMLWMNALQEFLNNEFMF